jgi:peptide-methionine (R)-S-oxide reductase
MATQLKVFRIMSKAEKNEKAGSGHPATSKAEWREKLSPEAFHITREHGTERAFSHPYNAEKRDGMYRCVCCSARLFSSGTKFDSGTGWPSFYAPYGDEAVGEQDDRSLFRRRTEVHCAKCEAHLGHVFPDGPEPTGARYCINGVALAFDSEDGNSDTNGNEPE